ncbi:hypothetical protein GOEFS_028_00300 [Gordonia effusa NBRC 100432]|uniref:Polyketide cyclase/dehydrase n=1 Tax=Gordonia effusa NBRC 100432 TaxID=1077974 RepID=H0QX15_9ACTN|nr:DUF5995 family protein [Gordonia effusa]GAB17366.1 hypothetical protein GOEFS_028_00300 [Gordonia effusa NBRC 100432]
MSYRSPAGFTLTRELSCPPEVAWRLLTNPDEMNRWSTAPIRLAYPGVGERPDAVGALRVVTLGGRGTKLREVVEYTEFPHLFRYRVYDGGPFLLEHHGQQCIDATDDGCRVTWTVEMRLISAVASRVLAKTVSRQVAESLDRCAALAVAPEQDTDTEETTATSARVSATVDELNRLRANAFGALAEQRAIADRLAATNDPKRWFARVYQYVTEEMIEAATSGSNTLTLDNPDWVLALIPEFHEYFTRNLTSYERGEETEPAWQRAWSTCERSNPAKPYLPVMTGLLAGVSAHIDADLPRALAAVHQQSYADRDIREFRPDYLRLTPIFSSASNRLLADLPRSHKPWWTPLAARIHPQVRDTLLARQGYDVGRHRVTAFAAAVELTELARPTPGQREHPC